MDGVVTNVLGHRQTRSHFYRAMDCD